MTFKAIDQGDLTPRVILQERLKFFHNRTQISKMVLEGNFIEEFIPFKGCVDLPNSVSCITLSSLRLGEVYEIADRQAESWTALKARLISVGSNHTVRGKKGRKSKHISQKKITFKKSTKMQE